MSDKEPTHHLTPFETLVLQRFDQLDARLDSMDKRLDSMDARLDSMDTRLDSMDARLTTLESKALDTKPIWEMALAELVEVKAEIVEIKTRLNDIDKRLHKVERALGILSEDVVHLRADLRSFDDRITALEGK